MQPNISLIAAMADNRVIGYQNQLPWRLPADMRHFKALTTGHAILMGRKTYQSIGKPLPNRTNIILTTDPLFQANGCLVVNSIDEAVNSLDANDEAIVIGGSEVYRLMLPYISRMYLTYIHHHFNGDAYFPEFEQSDWKEIAREDHRANQENAYDYSFVTLVKKQ